MGHNIHSERYRASIGTLSALKAIGYFLAACGGYQLRGDPYPASTREYDVALDRFSRRRYGETLARS